MMERLVFSVLLISFVWCGVSTADTGVPQIKGNRENEITINEGETATLDCPVERNPGLIIEWYKDGRLVDHQILTAFKIQRKITLVIYNVTQEEAGTFVCKAISGFGTVEISFSLLVHDKEIDEESYLTEIDGSLGGRDRPVGSKPTFIRSPSPQKGIIQKPMSSYVHLKCTAAGYPLPTVLWLKNGHEVKPEKDYIEFKKWTLIIRLRENDSGEYMCIVKNVFGSINATFPVDVIVPGPSQPELTEVHPINTTVEIGQMANFQCRVKSDQKPHIQWLKKLDDAATPPPSGSTFEFRGNRFMVLKKGEIALRDGHYLNKLMLPEVKESDSGIYVCLVANTMGYSYKEALLTVQQDHSWEKPGLHVVESSSLGSFSITLIICIPVTVIIVFAVVCLTVRCRSNYNTSVRCANKRVDNSSACTAPGAPRCPPNRASSSSSCAYSKNGNCVHKPIYNAEHQPDLKYTPQVMNGVPPSAPSLSWNSQQIPPHYYRKSGTITPSSSNGESRSGASVSLPKVHHHHHHQHRYHHQHIYCS